MSLSMAATISPGCAWKDDTVTDSLSAIGISINFPPVFSILPRISAIISSTFHNRELSAVMMHEICHFPPYLTHGIIDGSLELVSATMQRRRPNVSAYNPAMWIKQSFPCSCIVGNNPQERYILLGINDFHTSVNRICSNA